MTASADLRPYSSLSPSLSRAICPTESLSRVTRPHRYVSTRMPTRTTEANSLPMNEDGQFVQTASICNIYLGVFIVQGVELGGVEFVKVPMVTDAAKKQQMYIIRSTQK